jgi:hypothetical protein
LEKIGAVICPDFPGRTLLGAVSTGIRQIYLPAAGVLTTSSILPITRPKILAFHDLGSRRVEKAMIELVRPATTAIFLPGGSRWPLFRDDLPGSMHHR